MKSYLVIMTFIFAGLICAPLFANSRAGSPRTCRKDWHDHRGHALRQNDIGAVQEYHLSIASQNQGAFQDQVLLASTDDSYSRNEHYPEYKSESTANLLAIIPGFLIHGSGHFYAGDFMTGFILLGLEIPSLYMIGSWFGYQLMENRDEDESGYRSALGVAGAALFLGGWIYDFVHADAAVRDYNDKIRSQIYFRSNQAGRIDVGLALSF
ncbi:MAG: hypothetical protein GF310_10950 [candidate division Zixibacteria bacterium]|nr:hypothetical protein [candidate division Zixibacteria bacterium]